MNSLAKLPAQSTLQQKLRLLSADAVQHSQPSPMTERARTLLSSCPASTVVEGGVEYKRTVFHDIYTVQFEYELAGMRLGSFVDLDLCENPTLLDIKQAYGERTAITVILPHVAALNAASSASNRMDQAAITLCCRDIVSSFYYLGVAEFCVFCHRMRSLKYVTRRSDYVFGADTIMQGLNEFVRDLNAERRSYERDKQQNDTERYANAVSHEEAMATDEYKDTYRRITGSDPDGERPSLDSLSESLASKFAVEDKKKTKK